MDSDPVPSTLLEAIEYFSDEQHAFDILVALRWPDGITCPHCNSKENHGFVKTRKIWKCKSCKKQFSAKSGSIFENSNIKLKKWLAATWLLCDAKNGISSHELGRAIGVTQSTAWFILHRLRTALHAGNFDKRLQGIVEVDETYIGPKFGNMHYAKKLEKGLTGRGIAGKTIVMGFVERNGEVRTVIIPNTEIETFHAEVKKHVEPRSEVCTDQHASYKGLEDVYKHGFVTHRKQYVNGHIHTNNIECMWSHVKIPFKGTYICVDTFYLSRYLDEQAFRYNNRRGTDRDRFKKALGLISGKRITYKNLISHEQKAPRRGHPGKCSSKGQSEIGLQGA